MHTFLSYSLLMTYLDHITASPIDPRVLQIMQAYLHEHYGSPVSLHRYGQQAQQALEHARKQIAQLIHAKTEEIIFTASGTESDNLAIKGLAQAYSKKGRHLVISAVEHQAVLYAVRHLERQGYSVTEVPVDYDGLVHPAKVRQAMRDDTILVSITLASDEVGVIQPIEEIAQMVHEQEAIMHTDAVSAVGRMPVDVKTLGVDALSLSARSLNGPAGSAALFLKQGIRLRPQIEGGIQEEGRRSGHENLPAIVGFGTAAALTQSEMSARMVHLKRLEEQLLNGLKNRIPAISLNGHATHRLPGHLNLMIQDADSESMVLMLDAKNIAVSIGSTCASHASKTSYVLQAMGRTPRAAQSSLMITMGPSTPESDIERMIEVLPDVVAQLRHVAG